MTLKNSYNQWFLGLYSQMLKDISEQCQEIRRDCDRDYIRLHSAVNNRGYQFMLITLIDFGKHFDKCLDQARLVPSTLPCFKGYAKGSPVPRLFRGLVLRVFDRDGLLRPEPDVRAIRWIRQLTYCLKSFEIACPTRKLYETISEFVKTDAEVQCPTLNWDGIVLSGTGRDRLNVGDLYDHDTDPSGSCHPIDREALVLLQGVFDIATSLIGRFDPLEWDARHGPGAVSDLKGKVIDKYLLPLWSNRLDMQFPYSDLAFANYEYWADAINNQDIMPILPDWDGSDIEAQAQLIAVPKTYKGPRLIAAEPTAHQWCQQIVRSFMVARVKDTFLNSSIRFDDQTWNGKLALEASSSQTHATIDLSAASDRISCWLVERAFRRSPTLLDSLHACRTREVTQNLDKKQPQTIRLRKFSTMGSAVTFPIQSILFTLIAIGGVLHHRSIPLSQRAMEKIAREVRVFGDDIIVPVDAWPTVSSLLTALGLRINSDKTFGTGKFRESCGVDAYDGTNVSKVSVLCKPEVTKPGSVLSCVDVHNNLLMGGYEHAATYVREAVTTLRRYVFPSVPALSGVCGWATFGIPDNSTLRSRWNPELHRCEYRFSLVKSKTDRSPTTENSMMLQYFTEVPQNERSAPVRAGERLGAIIGRPSTGFRTGWAPIL